MVDFLNRNISPIGLDIDHEAVRMIQLAVHSDGIKVIAADEMRYGPEDDRAVRTKRNSTVSMIKTMLSRSDFKGRNVVLSLSNEKVQIKSLRLEAADNGEIEQILKAEAVSRFGLNAETDEIRHITAGTVRHGEVTKNELILFAAETETVEDYITMLEEVGLVPKAIDTVPGALFRNLQRSLRRHEDQEKISVLIEIRNDCTTVLIGKSGNIIFVKQIPIAAEQINNSVAEKLNITADEAFVLRNKLKQEKSAEEIDSATRQMIVDCVHKVVNELIKEISLCFRYYSVTFKEQRPRTIVLAGAYALEEIFVDALKRHLAVEVEMSEPLKKFDLSSVSFSDDQGGSFCQWTTAVGLAINDFAPAAEGMQVYEGINFLPDWHRDNRRRHMRYHGQYAAIVVLLMLLGAWSLLTSGNLSRARAALKNLANADTQQSSMASEIQTLQQQLSTLNTQAELLSRIDSKIVVSQMLAELSFLVDGRIVLSRIDIKEEPFSAAAGGLDSGSAVRLASSSNDTKTLDIDKPVIFSVEITGIAADAAEVAQLIRKLEASDYFSQVVPGYSRNVIVNGRHGSEFQIDCYLANYRLEN